MKILIAEDEVIHRAMLVDFVKTRMPFFTQIESVEDGRKALALCQDYKPDLALLDIQMPHINGIDCARQLKSRYPDIKIIFLTAYSQFDYAVEALRIGVSDYIVKPYHSGDIRSEERRVGKEC